MKARVVTVKQLEAYGACPQKVRRFRRVFGVKAAVTKANVRKAYLAGLPLGWAANILLTRLAFDRIYSPRASAAHDAFMADPRETPHGIAAANRTMWMARCAAFADAYNSQEACAPGKG